MVDFRTQQQLQYQHDIQNHFDVISLARSDRLKHYGLHFAKYAGRFARKEAETKTREQTIVDAMLVCLSAANALNQALSVVEDKQIVQDLQFTDAAGRFADACEKIDHLEDFRHIALAANSDIATWLVSSALSSQLDLDSKLTERRIQLGSRAVYSGT
jgi:phosphopantetheinyl transferase (holo-ACP synthase)